MQTLANLIIRPYRDNYLLKELRPNSFTLNRKQYIRKDIDLPSIRGKIVCSWFDSVKHMSSTCIIYCHGNSGSRLDSEEILESVLRYGMSLFSFDFGGCGLSDGEFVSLGHFEKEDISVVIKYIYSQNHNIHIVLWGRSMGAAASILYSFSNPHLTAMVLDSPFANFTQVADEMVADYKIVPKFLRDYLIRGTAEYIKKNYNFDIMKLNPINFAKNCKIPTIFIHSVDDKLVRIEHSKELYEMFKGPKCFMEIVGEHNTIRDKVVVMKALKIVLYLIGKSQKEEQEMATSRDHFPEFHPDLAEIIRHRRGESAVNFLN